MRLGEYRCKLVNGMRAQSAYGTPRIVRERHRHRYEVNNAYRTRFERSGFMVSGVNPDRNLVEIMELKKHPFFMGVQFHPEFKSYPLAPHPLFLEFIRACNKKARGSRP